MTESAFRLEAYHFDLPAEQIAQAPAGARDASRLLRVLPDGLEDRRFAEIVELLPADAVLVVNDTRVIPARVRGVRPTGGAVELFFLEEESPREDSALERAGVTGPCSVWRCLAKASGPLRPGQTIACGDTHVTIVEGRAADGTLLCAVPGDALTFLAARGELPLPHYIERRPEQEDQERYQTIFAQAPGAVAAPTAGLHMTPALVERLATRGIDLFPLTLHVGWGTFAPVRVEDVREHRMHEERYFIPERTATAIASGRPVVALGTTALRALEAAAIAPRQVAAGAGRTSLFVYPGSGHRFRVVDHLITNFHLPESTLLMLVCAFAGTERMFRAYRHAVAAGYRFFSYGDAMVVSRAEP